ncbi:MAG: hypothetical protein V8R75_10880 [Oscillospiraceae bacterium]
MEDYWSYRLENYPSDFRWTFADNPVPPENAASLTLSSGNGTASVQCWQGVNLVRCTLRDETVWLAAPITGADAVSDGTLFSAFREWYDGLEWDALQADILIPDEGQSHLKIAQAWSDAGSTVCAGRYLRRHLCMHLCAGHRRRGQRQMWETLIRMSRRP